MSSYKWNHAAVIYIYSFDRYCQTALYRGSTESMSNVRVNLKEEEKVNR